MSQENMENIMQRRPQYGDDEIRIARGVSAGSDPTAAIKAATGLDINLEDLQDSSKQARQEAQQSRMQVLTPDEAAQLGETYEKIDYQKQAQEERIAHMDKLAMEGVNKTVDMLKDALSEEEKREARISETLDDEEKREELYRGSEAAKQTGKVAYQPSMAEEASAESWNYEPPKQTIHQQSQVKRSQIESAVDIADTDDLVPSYDFEEDDAPAEAVDTKDQRPTPDQSTEEYSEYLRNLKTVNHGEEESDDSMIHIVRDKASMTPVDSGRMQKSKIVGDQAFLNAINKYKKDNFRTVSIPLVNSGFTVDIVGTGAVDLTLLYSAVDQNTLAVDYELEKMRTIIRNVVGTNPKIDRNDLRNMIHFADYQLMAYAHIAGTLKDVELLHTCDECGKDFHIISKSSDLILNMKDMRDKMSLIKNGAPIAENSLMATDQQMTTNSGFTIKLGHPSYSEYIQYLTEMKRLVTDLPQTVSTRLTTLTETLPFIRSIDLPNGVHTNSLYQRYLAVGLLNEDDYAELLDAINKMREKIITPRFGIKRVTCPHCGKVNTDIVYRDLNDLLFFHITVTRLLKKTEQ